MPLYEYTCPNGHTFEVLTNDSSATHDECPECGERAQRVISRTNFVLRGRGWFRNSNGEEKRQ